MIRILEPRIPYRTQAFGKKTQKTKTQARQIDLKAFYLQKKKSLSFQNHLKNSSGIPSGWIFNTVTPHVVPSSRGQPPTGPGV